MAADAPPQTRDRNRELRPRQESRSANSRSIRRGNGSGTTTALGDPESFRGRVAARTPCSGLQSSAYKMRLPRRVEGHSRFLHDEPETTTFAFKFQLLFGLPRTIRADAATMKAA